MERVLSTECEILLRLASPINKVVSNILHLVIRALQGLTDVRTRDFNQSLIYLFIYFYFFIEKSVLWFQLHNVLLYCKLVSCDRHVTLMCPQIWTVYMELHINDAVPEIVNSWRMIVDIILDLPTKQGMVILYRPSFHCVPYSLSPSVDV